MLAIVSANLVFGAGSADLVNNVDKLIASGKIAEAERQVDSALVISPTDYKLMIAKGNVLMAKDDYTEALDYFEKALAEKSKDPDALYGAGMAALKTDQADKSYDYFKRGEKTGKRKGDFLYGEALALEAQKKLADADATIRKAISKDKKNPLYHEALGNINYDKEVWAIAISEYNQALDLDSSLTDLYYKLARANFYSRNFTDAVKYYKIYLKQHDSDVKAWHELAQICVAANNNAEAVFCYKKLTEIEPNDGNNWYTLGDLEFTLNDYDGAAQALEKAISLNSNVAESYKRLAKIYQTKQEYYKADTAYTKYEEFVGAPTDPEYWFDKGKVMLKIGTKDASFFNNAIVAFDKAISLDSTDANYWEYAGLARYYKQDYAGAIPFFLKRIELGTENVNALRNLAFCYLKTEQYDKAASTLEKAVALKPEDGVMRKMLGKIYVFLSGSKPDQKDVYINKAIPHLKAALQDTTGDLTAADKCEIRGDLGYCYVTLTDAKSAIPYLEKAIQCDPKNVDYLFNLASAYHYDNEIKLAHEYYGKVLEIDPNHKAAKEGYLRTQPRG